MCIPQNGGVWLRTRGGPSERTCVAPPTYIIIIISWLTVRCPVAGHPSSRRPLGLGWGPWSSIGAHDTRPRKAFLPDGPGIYELGIRLPSGWRYSSSGLLLPPSGLHCPPPFCGTTAAAQRAATRSFSAAAATDDDNDNNVIALYIGQSGCSLRVRISSYLRQDGNGLVAEVGSLCWKVTPSKHCSAAYCTSSSSQAGVNSGGRLRSGIPDTDPGSHVVCTSSLRRDGRAVAPWGEPGPKLDAFVALQLDLGLGMVLRCDDGMAYLLAAGITSAAGSRSLGQAARTSRRCWKEASWLRSTTL